MKSQKATQLNKIIKWIPYSIWLLIFGFGITHISYYYGFRDVEYFYLGLFEFFVGIIGYIFKELQQIEDTHSSQNSSNKTANCLVTTANSRKGTSKDLPSTINNNKCKGQIQGGKKK
jgi:hypothetical protein